MEEENHSIELLRQAKRLLVITGAGISAESGIPTYRGPNGIYPANRDLATLMCAEGFAKDRDSVWRQIDEMRIRVAASEPNTAHRILAKWEKEERFSGFLIATQNIDGLHQRAGNHLVTELHGSLWQMARPRILEFTEDDSFSHDFKELAYPELRQEILRCWSEENEQQIWTDRIVPFPYIPPFDDPEVRPNIVFYDEGYGSRLVWAEDFIRTKPDVVLVIGCSGGVTLLPRLLLECRIANPDCTIININPHEDFVEIPHHYLCLPASIALESFD